MLADHDRQFGSNLQKTHKYKTSMAGCLRKGKIHLLFREENVFRTMFSPVLTQLAIFSYCISEKHSLFSAHFHIYTFLCIFLIFSTCSSILLFHFLLFSPFLFIIINFFLSYSQHKIFTHFLIQTFTFSC